MNSMEKQTCILVKELLPLYQDKAVSEESNHIIEEHLKECDSCKVLLDEMRKEDELEEGINQPTEEIKGDYKKERENYINLAKRLKKRRRIIICSTIVAVLFLFICFTSWFQTFFIAGGMEPTYEAGTNCVVNKLIYNFRAPKRGEVVVLSHHDIVIMKRIIGEPGDTIDIRHGKVYINKELLDSEYTFGSLNQKGNIKFPIVLGEEEYFVLGDNYEQSLDSRYLEFGLVSRDKIFGKVMFQTKFSLIRTTVTTATKE